MANPPLLLGCTMISFGDSAAKKSAVFRLQLQRDPRAPGLLPLQTPQISILLSISWQKLRAKARFWYQRLHLTIYNIGIAVLPEGKRAAKAEPTLQALYLRSSYSNSPDKYDNKAKCAQSFRFLRWRGRGRRRVRCGVFWYPFWPWRRSFDGHS